jgi:PLP dependent protein
MDKKTKEKIEDKIKKINSIIINKCKNKPIITLIAVTKHISTQVINSVIDSGINIIGESRIQEIEHKIPYLKECEKHMIGTLQKNKVKKAINLFDMIQSVHSKKILEEINKEAQKINKIQRILLQINIGEEKQKHGFNKNEIKEIYNYSKKLNNVKVEGIMCIAPYFEDNEKVRPYFKEMKQIFD